MHILHSLIAVTLLAVAAPAVAADHETTVASDPGAATPAVPEPATWAMLIMGFCLTSAAMGTRRPQIFAV